MQGIWAGQKLDHTTTAGGHREFNGRETSTWGAGGAVDDGQRDRVVSVTNYYPEQSYSLPNQKLTASERQFLTYDA